MSSLIATIPRDVLEALAAHPDPQVPTIFFHDWHNFCRPGQAAPEGVWRTWLILAGRGFGKTRAGAEWVRERVRRGARRIALIGPTIADARDIMVLGESGLLAVCAETDVTAAGAMLGRPQFQTSRRRLVWQNGAEAMVFSSEEPERLRGPQHEAIWADELCAWAHARQTWDMAMFGLRLGREPRTVITTTPKPLKLLREILDDAGTAVTGGSTYDNAENLSPAFLDAMRAKYEGSRLGRQELNAEILEEEEGAMWSRDMLDELRRATPEGLKRIVVAVDPPAGAKETSDACGIVAAGLCDDGRAHVIADATIRAAKPADWAARVVALYEALDADLVLAEVNQGGDMVEAVIRQVDANVPLKKVHANRGKWLRAEPVAALYQQHKVTHAPGLGELEDEMCAFRSDGLSSGKSPDRLDALVWAVGELLLNRRGEPRVRGL